jgi:hypothetical protein
MEIPKILKTLSTLEMVLLACFAIYVIFPIPTPNFLAGVLDSSLGMLVLFVVGLFLFFYVNPVLGVLFILVAYEMLRRSSHLVGHTAIVQHTPSQAKKDIQMINMNPPKKETLEEEIVDKMAPVGQSDLSIYTPSSFKPVSENVGSASLV